jgi:hypothetical protein
VKLKLRNEDAVDNCKPKTDARLKPKTMPELRFEFPSNTMAELKSQHVVLSLCGGAPEGNENNEPERRERMSPEAAEVVHGLLHEVEHFLGYYSDHLNDVQFGLFCQGKVFINCTNEEIQVHHVSLVNTTQKKFVRWRKINFSSGFCLRDERFTELLQACDAIHEDSEEHEYHCDTKAEFKVKRKRFDTCNSELLLCLEKEIGELVYIEPSIGSVFRYESIL